MVQSHSVCTFTFGYTLVPRYRNGFAPTLVMFGWFRDWLERLANFEDEISLRVVGCNDSGF